MTPPEKLTFVELHYLAGVLAHYIIGLSGILNPSQVREAKILENKLVRIAKQQEDTE